MDLCVLENNCTRPLGFLVMSPTCFSNSKLDIEDEFDDELEVLVCENEEIVVDVDGACVPFFSSMGIT